MKKNVLAVHSVQEIVLLTLLQVNVNRPITSILKNALNVVPVWRNANSVQFSLINEEGRNGIDKTDHRWETG